MLTPSVVQTIDFNILSAFYLVISSLCCILQVYNFNGKNEPFSFPDLFGVSISYSSLLFLSIRISQSPTNKNTIIDIMAHVTKPYLKERKLPLNRGRLMTCRLLRLITFQALRVSDRVCDSKRLPEIMNPKCQLSLRMMGVTLLYCDVCSVSIRMKQILLQTECHLSIW